MDIPGRFLPQVMADLVAAGLVEGRTGRTGGYRLARPAAAISLLDVIAAVELRAGASDLRPARRAVRIRRTVRGPRRVHRGASGDARAPRHGLPGRRGRRRARLTATAVRPAVSRSGHESRIDRPFGPRRLLAGASIIHVPRRYVFPGRRSEVSACADRSLLPLVFLVLAASAGCLFDGDCADLDVPAGRRRRAPRRSPPAAPVTDRPTVAMRSHGAAVAGSPRDHRLRPRVQADQIRGRCSRAVRGHAQEHRRHAPRPHVPRRDHDRDRSSREVGDRRGRRPGGRSRPSCARSRATRRRA